MLKALSIAKWFVDRADKEFVDDNGLSEGLTNLKLQKLLYFGQAVSLSLRKVPLFEDKIEAWKFGPVVPAVYDFLKVFGNKPVTITANTEEIDAETAGLLEDVWSVYGKFSAHELVNISHSHLPWKEIFLSGSENSGEITQERIKEYYTDYYITA